jgi:6-phosphogluconolactonase
MKSLRVFSDSVAMAEEMARCWCELARQATNNQHVFTVVLSGGSTAPLLYGKLAEPEWRNNIPWKAVHIFFADERCVAPNNEESNYKIIYDHLLSQIPIPKENVHRIRGEENPEKEAIRYTKVIQNHLALRNGHTASLFPGQDIINSTKLCKATQNPDTMQNRITITLAALNKSARITYHVIGEKKSEIVVKLVSKPSSSNIYPVSQIQGELFLDRQAASKIDISRME